MLYNTEMGQNKSIENNIKTLVLQAKNGDSLAFDSLYNIYYQPLYRFVLYKTSDKELTLDICQDTFLAWYKSLETYVLDIKIENYLFFIAKRLIINNSKKKFAVELTEDLEESWSNNNQTLSLEEEIDISINFKEIEKSFEILNETEKDVISLKYISDRTNSEIAEIIGKNEVNIRQIEHRAIKKIKTKLQNKKL